MESMHVKNLRTGVRKSVRKFLSILNGIWDNDLTENKTLKII